LAAEKVTSQYLDEANKLATRMFAVIGSAATPFREQMAKS
jgi:hypothetical protein